MKKIVTIFLMAFAIVMLSCSNEDITGSNGGGTDDSGVSGGDGGTTESSITLDFRRIGIMDEPPKENIWIITDKVAPEEGKDFENLRRILEKASEGGRKIQIEFPNIVAINTDAFDARNKTLSLVSITANKAEKIGDRAFIYCEDLTNVSFPIDLEIGMNAFDNCRALTTVDIPMAMTIKAGAFLNCTSLTTVDFPDAGWVGAEAFNTCRNLTTVNLPKMYIIRDNAFYNCSSLVNMTISTTAEYEMEPIGTDAFTGSFPDRIEVTTGKEGNRMKFIDAGFIGKNIRVLN